jgi:hypothetical protein
MMKKIKYFLYAFAAKYSRVTRPDSRKNAQILSPHANRQRALRRPSGLIVAAKWQISLFIELFRFA